MRDFTIRAFFFIVNITLRNFTRGVAGRGSDSAGLLLARHRIVHTGMTLWLPTDNDGCQNVLATGEASRQKEAATDPQELLQFKHLIFVLSI